MKPTIKFCGTELIRSKVNYALCLDSKKFYAQLKAKGVDDPPLFISQGFNSATTHFFEGDFSWVCLVCMDLVKSLAHTPIEIAGLLVHEAVHIWQKDCELRGEEEPSKEYEAYAIQIISQNLMWQYRDALKNHQSKNLSTKPLDKSKAVK